MKSGTTRQRRDRGAVLPLMALLMATLVLMVSFTVDLGRLMLARRQMQAAADIVALDMVRLANGRTELAILTHKSYGDTLARTAEANGLENDILEIVYGQYDLDTETFIETTANEVPNAVRVVSTRGVEYLVQPGGKSANRTATAFQRDIAHLSLGSRFAKANPPGITPTGADELDAYLSALLGYDISFGALTYDGLVTANVTLGDLSTAGGFGTVEEFLAADLTLEEMAEISATALENNGDSARAGYYTGLGDKVRESGGSADGTEAEEPVGGAGDDAGDAADDVDSGEFRQPPVHRPDAVPPSEYIDLDQPGQAAAAVVIINLFDMFTAAVEASNLRNALTTCTGTVSPDEIRDDQGGVIEPVDMGPAAIVSDELCSTIVAARKHGIGGVGDRAVSAPEFRTAQVVVTHTSLIRFGQGNFGLPGVPIPQSPVSDRLPPLSLPIGLPQSPISGDLAIPIKFEGGGAAGTLTEIICDEASGVHTVDTYINPRPLDLTLGYGQNTPIGTLQVAGVGTVKIFLDKFIQPATDNPETIQDLPVGQTADGPGSDPTLGLFVGPNDVRLEFESPLIPTTTTTSSTTTTLPELPPVTAPTITTVTTSPIVPLRQQRQAGPQQRQAGPVPTTTPSTPTSVTTPPGVPTETVPPPPDLTEQAIREYVAQIANHTLQKRIRDGIQPTLNDLGVSVASSDLTNVGVGIPLYGPDGSVVAIDVQCATPTLVK